MAGIKELIAGIQLGFLDALYPKGCACMLCDNEAAVGEDQLCNACRESLRRCVRPVCTEPLDGLSAAFVYENAVRDAIHRFKYQRATYLARFFADEILIPAEWSIDCLVPVPLHNKKLRERGYNQSERLAKYIGQRIGKPLRADMLVRTRNTASQTLLDADARRKNVRGAFDVASDCKDLSIVLIDDVTTTGATLSECAHILKIAGAKRVYALCAACAHA